MRSFRVLAATSVVAALALSACSGSTDSAASGAASGDVLTLNVGASPVPHAKILQFIDEKLAPAAGLDLEIVEYNDYILPNVALNDGDLDANFYQTIPYLEDQAAEYGYEFTPGAGVHLEPLAVYSASLKSLADLPDGGTIGIISDVTNQARALKLLAGEGLVELPASGDINIHTVKPLKNFTFTEVEGAQLVRALSDVDAAVINGNFAQEGGLSPEKDGLAVESSENNPASNLLVWKSDISGEKAEGVKKLEELLHTDEVRQFIQDNWSDGSVIPSF
ncbi:MetQ/NlpA family ABC transporter substrate-binding protein [Schaalia sp. Marseille-Q2122]|uniref:MetQ/NlpA family ABC transporter substrate-binding protein n=1 Tax=Schaalia sp. Marseille-Q2122 TaxID=2736604 RepID=UPI00158861F2|nr:MetQ/NlpA family ABC transporter substrate-binding protein [Schaalia sp. Marseille-Q2122]